MSRSSLLPKPHPSSLIFSFPLPATLTASCQGPLYTGLRFSRSICLISSMSAMHTSSDSKERPSRSAKCPEKGEGRTGHLDERPSFSSKQPVWWQKNKHDWGSVYAVSPYNCKTLFMHHTGTEGMVPQEAAPGFPLAHTFGIFSGTLA